jgi:hypothetical protein
MRKTLTCLAFITLCVPLALPQLPQKPAGPKLVPLGYQAIGADLKPFGPVYPYIDSAVSPHERLAFDCFGADSLTGDPTDGIYGATCFALGSTIRWGGNEYDNPHFAGDMHLSPGTEGRLASRMETAWWDNRLAPEQFYIICFPIEDFDASCTGPAFAKTYDGVIFDFGVVAPSTAGYYWTNATLGHVPFQLPVDGVGGFVTFYAKAVTDAAVTLTTPFVQPMLWGTMDPGCTPPGTNTSFQVAAQWDDDNPLDGTFNPSPPPVGECYNYFFGVCPNPLGPMYAFWVFKENDVRCDANCDGYFDGFDIEPFFVLLTNIEVWTFRYPGCDALDAGDANCDGYVDGFDIDPLFFGLEVGECVCP